MEINPLFEIYSCTIRSTAGQKTKELLLAGKNLFQLVQKAFALRHYRAVFQRGELAKELPLPFCQFFGDFDKDLDQFIPDLVRAKVGKALSP